MWDWGRRARAIVAVATAGALAGCGAGTAATHSSRARPSVRHTERHQAVNEVARTVVSRVLGATEPRYFVSSRRRVTTDGLSARFEPAGAVVRAGGVAWTLSAPAVHPVVGTNRVTYTQGGIREGLPPGRSASSRASPSRTRPPTARSPFRSAVSRSVSASGSRPPHTTPHWSARAVQCCATAALPPVTGGEGL